MSKQSNGVLASAGPFQGVRYVDDAPYLDASEFLLFATNGYMRDAANASSWVARPGFTNTNPSTLIASGHRTLGMHTHIDPTTGTAHRFFAANGKMYRSNSTFSVFTDVSPVGIAISTNDVNTVSFLSVGASLVVTDGTNKPWILTNPSATPVTGDYIDIDGAGGSWSSWGKPTIYQDSVFFITATVPGGSAVTPRIGIVWSEPNQPAVGYTQSGYANFWNLIQTGSEPLYAILGTNNGLFYWRQDSIGVASGTPSVNFSTTATRDAIGDPVGTVSPWAVAQFQNNIFFLDARGRPWMMPIGGAPQPIWRALETRTINHSALATTTISRFAVGAIVPELNQYIVAIWPLADTEAPTQASVFDGATGAYGGEWYVGQTQFWNALDVMLNSAGERVLCIAGGAIGTSGYIWILNTLIAGVWSDTGIFTASTFVTGRLGYSATRNISPSRAVMIVRSAETIPSVRVATSYENYSLSNISPVSQSNAPVAGDTEQEFRAEMGLDGSVTRWVSFQVNGPFAPTAQWGVQRVEVFGSTSVTGPDDR